MDSWVRSLHNLQENSVGERKEGEIFEQTAEVAITGSSRKKSKAYIVENFELYLIIITSKQLELNMFRITGLRICLEKKFELGFKKKKNLAIIGISVTTLNNKSKWVGENN